jgi:hypothetical protein
MAWLWSWTCSLAKMLENWAYLYRFRESRRADSNRLLLIMSDVRVS